MTTSRVPIGFKFRPTVQETLIKYLKPKIFGEILPKDNPIREVNIYSCHPSELFKDLEDDDEYEIQRYFYTTLEKVNENGRNYIRRIKDVGKWDGEYPKKILDAHGEVIGFDKYFKFVPETKKDSDKTKEWNMHEYSIKPELLPQGIDEEKKNLVVCRMVMIVKGNSQAKNKSRVIRLSKAPLLSCSNAVPNMMMMHPPQINYVFNAEQDKEPPLKTQETTIEDHAIVCSSNLSRNIVGPYNGSDGSSSNMEGMGERIELHNWYGNGFQNPPIGDASNANMMVMHPPQLNYFFTAEQEKEPTWMTQGTNEIIMDNSEDNAIVCSDFGSNIVGPSYGIDGSSYTGGIGEGIELCNGYDNGFLNLLMGDDSNANMMMTHPPQINYAQQAEEPLWKQASDQIIVDNSKDHTTCSDYSSSVDQSYGDLGSNNMEGVGEGLELYNNGYDYGFQNPPMGDDNNVNMMMMHPPQVANALAAQEQEKLNQLEAFLLSSD